MFLECWAWETPWLWERSGIVALYLQQTPCGRGSPPSLPQRCIWMGGSWGCISAAVWTAAMGRRRQPECRQCRWLPGTTWSMNLWKVWATLCSPKFIMENSKKLKEIMMTAEWPKTTQITAILSSDETYNVIRIWGCSSNKPLLFSTYSRENVIIWGVTVKNLNVRQITGKRQVLLSLHKANWRQWFVM